MKNKILIIGIALVSVLIISFVIAESNETEINETIEETNGIGINITETDNETIESNETEIADMPKAGTTPDSAFYGVDVFFDNARATLTPGSLGKAKVRLNIMGERMAEMEQMANENQAEEAQRAELEMRKQMQKFEGSMEKVKKKDAMKLNEHIQTHAEILEILKERFEDFGQPDYTDAIAEAVKLLEESEGIIINIPENLSPDAIFMISASCQEAGATTAEECNELLASGLLTAQPHYCTPDEPCDDLPSYPAQEYPCSGGGSYWNYKTKWCCDDSDGLYSPEYVEFTTGLNMLDYYYMKGTVEYKIITLKTGETEEGIERDSCNGDTLTEWLCPTTMSKVTRNERYSKEYVCPYGCEDGACLICNSNSICDEKEDCSCSDCEGKRNGCEGQDFVCQNGDCVYEAEGVELECIDSDEGQDYFVKGNVTASHTIGLTTYYHYARDSCIDDLQLKESLCETNKIRVITYSCPNGCQDGACISG